MRKMDVMFLKSSDYSNQYPIKEFSMLNGSKEIVKNGKPYNEAENFSLIVGLTSNDALKIATSLSKSDWLTVKENCVMPEILG